MKEKFKAYLEVQFRQIAPTKKAMEYRKQMLTNMLDRAQELKIKGIDDEELICSMVIAELGDFSKKLKDFERTTNRRAIVRNSVLASIAIGVAVVLLLTISYMIVGAVSGIWHPTWLIMVGGIFAGICVVLVYALIKLFKNKKYLAARAVLPVIEVLISVFIFLLLQLVFKFKGSWLTFLAMVALIAGIDTGVAFITDSRSRWWQFPIFVEVFCAMLYVTLGIALSLHGVRDFWHPGWVICLGGAVALFIELAVILFVRASRRKKEQNAIEKIEDEKYWTDWDDEDDVTTGGQ